MASKAAQPAADEPRPVYRIGYEKPAYPTIESVPAGTTFAFHGWQSRPRGWPQGQQVYAVDTSSAAAGLAHASPLTGQYGLAWLADALSMAMEESMFRERELLTESQKLERAKRRKAKEALYKEAYDAKRVATRKGAV